MLHPRKALTQKKKIKEDKFANGLFSVWEMVKGHARNILYGAGAVIAVILIIVTVRSSGASSRREARLTLAKADAAADAGNTEEAMNLYQQMVDRMGDNDYTGRACLSIAGIFFRKGDIPGAEKYYTLYQERYAGSIMDPAAGGGLAACAENSGDQKKAGDLYRKTADKFAKSHLAPVYLSAAARCYKAAGQLDDARECLQTVTEKYAESQYAKDAATGLADLKALAAF